MTRNGICRKSDRIDRFPKLLIMNKSLNIFAPNI